VAETDWVEDAVEETVLVSVADCEEVPVEVWLLETELVTDVVTELVPVCDTELVAVLVAVVLADPVWEKVTDAD
jgi:hypothetical protein